ncbi:hypothetical protein MRX96_019496 [Rhipicephalus microplus]
MTTPSAAATSRSQSPRAAQHKATPRPAPVPAPQPATTVQRGAAMGLNTESPLLIGNPAAAQPGMFLAGPAQGTFLLNQYIPGLGHSPILIQGALGQTPSSLGQIQGVQLALRPPHATGLTLGPQTGPRPHGGHPGPPGTPTLVIPQNLGPRPNIFLAPPRMMSPPSFAIVPGQPLTLQQLQAMLPTQTMLAQPTLAGVKKHWPLHLTEARRVRTRLLPLPRMRSGLHSVRDGNITRGSSGETPELCQHKGDKNNERPLTRTGPERASLASITTVSQHDGNAPAMRTHSSGWARDAFQASSRYTSENV